MSCNQIDTSKKYQYSVNQKLLIMNGVFHNIECGMKMQRINPAIGELDGSKWKI